MGEAIKMERTQGHWKPSEAGIAKARKMIGAPLVRAREGQGLTLAKAANMAGVKLADYARAELGECRLPLESLRLLAATYRCNVRDLRLNNCIPAAPVDPEARLRWVRAWNSACADGRIKGWPGGTEGGKRHGD